MPQRKPFPSERANAGRFAEEGTSKANRVSKKRKMLKRRKQKATAQKNSQWFGSAYSKMDKQEKAEGDGDAEDKNTGGEGEHKTAHPKAGKKDRAGADTGGKPWQEEELLEPAPTAAQQSMSPNWQRLLMSMGGPKTNKKRKTAAPAAAPAPAERSADASAAPAVKKREFTNAPRVHDRAPPRKADRREGKSAGFAPFDKDGDDDGGDDDNARPTLPKWRRHGSTSAEVAPAEDDAERTMMKSLNSALRDHDMRAEDAIAIDCEMVGVGASGKKSMLARVALVNGTGEVLYDKYVRAMEKVTDYRTHVSGILPHHVRHKNASPLPEVQKEVARFLKDKMLVGHAIKNDLACLFMDHPRSRVRDTSLYPPFRSKDGRPRALRHLCRENLPDMQDFQAPGESHSPVEDALATLRLYAVVAKTWERDVKSGKIKRSMRARKSDSAPRKRKVKVVST